MDYKRIYDALIERGRNRVIEGYSESHHIVPRCMGGSDDADNLVRLTPEEHYVAHQLLVKIYPGNPNLIRAVHLMAGKRPGNKPCGWIRRKIAEQQRDFMREMRTGKLSAGYGRIWINNGSKHRRILPGEPIPEGWVEGMLPNKGMFLGSLIWVTNGVEENRINKNDSLPNGWWLGRKTRIHEKKQKKFKWITDGFKDRKRPIEEPIPSGWRLGRSTVSEATKSGSKWISNGVEHRRVSAGEAIPEGWTQTRIEGFHKATELLNRVKIFEATPKKLSKKQQRMKEEKEIYEKYYAIYKNGGFAAVQEAGFSGCHSSLLYFLKKYVPEYKPERGKYMVNRKKNGG